MSFKFIQNNDSSILEWEKDNVKIEIENKIFKIIKSGVANNLKDFYLKIIKIYKNNKELNKNIIYKDYIEEFKEVINDALKNKEIKEYRKNNETLLYERFSWSKNSLFLIIEEKTNIKNKNSVYKIFFYNSDLKEIINISGVNDKDLISLYDILIKYPQF